MEWMMSSEIWLALFTLTALEIVLGIDNLIFIAILVEKLPQEQQRFGRTIGLGLAMLTRIALLFSLTLIMKLTAPLFSVFAIEISGKDIIMLGGGLFLLGKSTLEIHGNLEGEEEAHAKSGGKGTLIGVVVQIMVIDIVFSLDSVITAIGLAKNVGVMVAAIIIAVVVMMLVAGKISDFLKEHPTIKILALSFLLLIGMSLIGEGLDFHMPKGYIYFAMAFSAFIEILNTKVRKNTAKPVKLRKAYSEDE